MVEGEWILEWWSLLSATLVEQARVAFSKTVTLSGPVPPNRRSTGKPVAGFR